MVYNCFNSFYKLKVCIPVMDEPKVVRLEVEEMEVSGPVVDEPGDGELEVGELVF